MILLRVSICNPLVAKNFAAYRMEEPNVPGDDPETTWRSIVVRTEPQNRVISLLFVLALLQRKWSSAPRALRSTGWLS